jgi:hypothetical protein
MKKLHCIPVHRMLPKWVLKCCLNTFKTLSLTKSLKRLEPHLAHSGFLSWPQDVCGIYCVFITTVVDVRRWLMACHEVQTLWSSAYIALRVDCYLVWIPCEKRGSGSSRRNHCSFSVNCCIRNGFGVSLRSCLWNKIVYERIAEIIFNITNNY